MEAQKKLKTKVQNFAIVEEQHLAAKSVSKTKKSTFSKVTTMNQSFEASSIDTTQTCIETKKERELCGEINGTSEKIKSNSQKLKKTNTTKAKSTFVVEAQIDEQPKNVSKESMSSYIQKDNTEVSVESSPETIVKKKTKAKKIKKSETDTQNISVKSSFTKFDALQKRNLIHVRSSDTGKAQEKFSNTQGEEGSYCRLCSKPVYKMEEIKAEKNIFHKNCFRCHECNKQLKVDSYQCHEGDLFCTMHYKLLFVPKVVVDTDLEKPRKPELIIRENQPVELPPDVVRASNKSDLGLEELQQLNVRSRFQVFESGVAQQSEETECNSIKSSSEIKRSTSILTKLARLKALGFNIENVNVDLAPIKDEDNDTTGSDNENGSDENSDDLDVVRKGVPVRECPVGLGDAMNDICKKFEKGNMSKEDRREERKQEIQSIRSRLFMGKQAKIKEMYQQAVAESEQAIISADKKPEIEIGGAARFLKERFENGDVFKDKDQELIGDEVARSGKPDESDVFESAISKKSRSIFMELDANVAATKKQTSYSNQMKGEHSTKKFISEAELENVTPPNKQIVKCDEKTEDVQITTSDISQKFKFFETYRPSEQRQRKEFRITPPRDGVVKMPSPESNNHQADEKSQVKDLELAKSHTTSTMLSKFREIEQNSRIAEQNVGPKPLKRFTPPPEGERRLYQDGESDGYSQEEEDEDEDDDEENSSDGDFDGHYRSNLHKDDEALKEAQAAARAKHLRAKFEKWEANEIQREIKEQRVDIYAQNVSDNSTIESAKLIRERFENMKNAEKKTPAKPTYQVNRFV